MRNPLATLQYAAKCLNPGGRIVASIPNLMHISVMEKLLGGNFTYTETGLLDKTHIHFFTFNEIVNMFKETVLNLEKIRPIVFPTTAEQDELIQKLLSLNDQAAEHMYKTFQYLVVAVV